MPMYTYKCDTCERTCDRRTSLSERDTATRCTPDGAESFEGHPTCPGFLVRDGVALTAPMKYNWGSWQ